MQGLNYQGYNSWLGTSNSGEALAELSSLIQLHVNMIILNELQTRLNCKNISSFCSVFKCSAPSCFRYSKNLPFLQLTKNIFRINDAQHPPTIPRKVTSLKIKLQQDFTVRIFPFLANHSFPHKQECFQLSEPS